MNSHNYGEGIYFNMPEEEYHALPMLSATGMKSILVSPVNFWHGSWMNKAREFDKDTTAAQIIGKAYHKRILEKSEAFNLEYAAAYSPDPDCLDTIKDMRAALEAAGIGVMSKWQKPDYISACAQFLPNCKIADIEERRYKEAIGTRHPLPAETITQIEIAAAMIEMHPELKLLFNGGFTEVTIIWLKDGIWFKARLDYMKPAAVCDLKTFSNTKNLPIDSALYLTMANYKYHIQATHYLNAVDRAKLLVRACLDDGANTVFADSAKHSVADIKAFCQALAKAPAPDFYFCFQQKGDAPLARAKRFGRGSMYQCGQASIEKACQLYVENFARFGEEMWVDLTPITAFEDERFPVYAVEL